MKKKLKIESLKVQSFLTELEKKGAEAKGGGDSLTCTMRGLPTTDCLTGNYPTFAAPCPAICH